MKLRPVQKAQYWLLGLTPHAAPLGSLSAERSHTSKVGDLVGTRGMPSLPMTTEPSLVGAIVGTSVGAAVLGTQQE